MEPPGGLPPDRDRQLVLHSSSQHPQQPLVPLQKPNFTLNLPKQPLQPQHSHAATSPAPPPIVTITALAALGDASASSNSNAAAIGATIAASTTTAATAAANLPALASTATAISATAAAATAFSGSSVTHHHTAPHPSRLYHPLSQSTTHLHSQHQQPQPQPQPQSQPQPHNNSSTSSSSLLGGITATSTASIGGAAQAQQTIEKLSRPLAFDKMESLVREMQDPEHGVPVRQQKMFLTSIPYAFMGYDLIEWLMDRLLIEESEALNIANQLCLHGYFFPVNDTKTLVVKDDSSLYRFQTPYYWPWQHKAPDNVEYAIYLAKRSLRNKQRHALEDYEAEALASLHKNLKGKWDFISMQAEEQVRLAKERKKGDKIVGDSQERAYWRVHRPPPGQFTPLEPCPVPSRDRQGTKTNKKKTIDDVQREVDYLKKSLNRTRMKMSQACESLVSYSETFAEYDAFLQPVLPSNPWVTEDIAYWQLNNTFVDVPTEKRVKRWAINIEELVSDPTGLQEFTFFLEKEYSHENIRFWNAVNQLRRSAHSQVARKVTEIFEEFLKPGAPCEINIDGKTMESVLKGLKNPSRFTFDSASEHIYMLLLKKDCYPRFVRSDHFKRLLETGIQPSHKKRFFGFGGVSGAKKKMVATLSNQPNEGTSAASSSKMGTVGGMMQAPPPGSLARRRGSDRSLTGSAHELAVIGVNKDAPNKVPHSHSQSNLSEIPYSESVYRGDMPTRLLAMDAGVYGAYGTRDKRLQRAIQEPPKPKLSAVRLETTVESSGSAVCPWDLPDEPPALSPPPPMKTAAKVQLSVCPWEQESEESSQVVVAIKSGPQRHTSTSSDNSDVSERLQRSLGIRHQNTVDSGETSGMKRLLPNFSEQRRASVSFTPSRISEYQVGRTASSKTTGTPSPTIGSQIVVDTTFAPLFTPLTHIGRNTITKDPPSTSSETELEEELNKLALTSEHSAETVKFSDELPQPKPQQQLKSTKTTKTTSTSPPTTKITPPPESENGKAAAVAATTTTTVDRQIAASPLTIVTEQEVATESSQISQIQEVQIELIETDVFVDPTTITTSKSPQRAIVHKSKVQATPIINVQECAIIAESELSAENSNSNSPTPKSPKIALEELQAAVDIADLGSYLDAAKISTSDKSSAVSLELMAVSCEASPQRPIPSVIPPPLPTVGPMEEEMLQDDNDDDDDDDDDVEEDEDIYVEEAKCTQAAFQEQEELSPTTDEYQEGIQFGADSKDVYDYDIVDTDDTQTGYIAPAPTPAPTMAPLAELDVDTVDDEPMDENDEDEDVLVVEQLIRTPPKSPPNSPDIQPPPLAVAEKVVSTAAAVVAENVAATTTAGVVTAATAVTASTEEVKKRRKKRYSDGKKITSMDEKDKDKAAGGEAKADADRNTVCPWEDENVTTSDGTFVKTYATLGYL